MCTIRAKMWVRFEEGGLMTVNFDWPFPFLPTAQGFKLHFDHVYFELDFLDTDEEGEPNGLEVKDCRVIVGNPEPLRFQVELSEGWMPRKLEGEAGVYSLFQFWEFLKWLPRINGEVESFDDAPDWVYYVLDAVRDNPHYSWEQFWQTAKEELLQPAST